MSPVVVGASRFATALETGTAKLWVLLIGVNQYQDITFPPLRYAAIDCQGIGTALAAATDPFPNKEFLIHHDLVAQTPKLATVESSLHRVVREAKVQDTILIYFSGHGVVEPIGQQTVLCLYDTDREHLLSTGLPIQVVLDMLRHCAAHSQLLWLDACHSGNMRSPDQSSRLKMGTEIDHHQSLNQNWKNRLNPTTQLLSSLRQAVSNRGFYALLSCDEGQQSWEFPDLGHGVFSYYLMRGLGGEAADDQGIIDADGLYRYVYRQTMQYIDRTNQQVRLANQVKRERGEMSCAPEYSPQTPKRIVSGVGEIILGIKSPAVFSQPDRSALIIDGGKEEIRSELDTLSHVLAQEGKFTLDRFPVTSGTSLVSLSAVEDRIQTFLRGGVVQGERFSRGEAPPTTQPPSTRLLYLRGQIGNLGGKDAGLVMGDGIKLSRTWLGQKLNQSSHNQQILIVDAPGATATTEWVEALKMVAGNLCIIVCAAPVEDPELFIQVLIEALISAPPQVGVPVVSLFTRLQTTLDALGISCDLFLSGTQGLIEIVPAAEIEQIELPPEIIIQTEISAPPDNLRFSAASDITFGQDSTYLQPVQEKIPVSSSISQDSLESILSRLVGPIASTLIKRAQAKDITTTIDNLRLMLPSQFKDTFDRQVQALLVKPPVPTPQKREQQVLETTVSHPSFYVASGRGISAPPHVGIDESAFRAYEHELNLAIGPISKFIVNSTRKAHPQISAPDLIAVLASNITDPNRADLFRQKCRDLFE